MALVFNSGFEGGNTFEWSSVTGSPSVQSAIKKTGTYAMRCNTSEATAYVNNLDNLGVIIFCLRLNFQLYITTAPNSECRIIGAIVDSAELNLRLTTDRYLKLYEGNSTLLGTSTTQLSTGQFYRICLCAVGATNRKLYINGGVEFTFSSAENISQRVGVLNAVTTDLYFDDISMDSASGADLGDIRTLISLPSGAGSYAQFDTVSGYTNVDETPALLSDLDFVHHAGKLTNKYIESYNFQDCATIGVGTGTVQAISTWARMAKGTGSGELHGIHVRDNAEDKTTDLVLTTSYAWNNGTKYNRYDAVLPRTAGGVWTNTIFDALEAGVFHGAAGTGYAVDTLCSVVWIMVAFLVAAAPAVAYFPRSHGYIIG